MPIQWYASPLSSPRLSINHSSAQVDKLFNPFTLLLGPVFVSILIYKTTIPVAQGGFHLPWWNVVLSYVVWLFATRTAKLLPHLWHRPQDVIYVPAFILFGYYFAIMKLYALCTLHEVSSSFLFFPALSSASLTCPRADRLGYSCRHRRRRSRHRRRRRSKCQPRHTPGPPGKTILLRLCEPLHAQ